MRPSAPLGPVARFPQATALAPAFAILLGAYLVVTGTSPVVASLPFRSAWLAVVLPGAAAVTAARSGPTAASFRSSLLRATTAAVGSGILLAVAHLVPGLKLLPGPAPSLAALVFGGSGGGVLVGVAGRHRPTALDCLVLEAAVAMGLTDLSLLQGTAVRDIRLYLDAGQRFLAGAPVYLAAPLHGSLPDATHLPYVYPPPTLPFFAALARLPSAIAIVAWEVASVLAAVCSLRAIGLPWRWSLALLAWPPFAQGLYVGNVAVPAFALFALAPWQPALLVLGPIFKLQAGLPSLWLLRERRLGALVGGALGLLALGLLTLPLTGTGAWADWLNGLLAYQRSQAAYPSTFYAYALPRFLPYLLYLVVAAVALAAALIPRGKVGLSALGLASVVASPSLYTHGFLPALPALLVLAPSVLWLALGLTSALPVPGWWVAVGLGWAGFVAGGLRHDPADTSLHPLGSESAAWPAADAG